VNSPKHVLYEAYDAETGGNLVDRRILKFQEFQVLDYIINYEESKPIARVELTILDVYDGNYSSYDKCLHVVANCWNNYGGFSEIYWHLDPVSDPNPTQFLYPMDIFCEDSVRFKDKENPTMVDQGQYFTNANGDEIGLNALSGSLYTGVSKTDRKTNERYCFGSEMLITGNNAHIGNEYIREFHEELKRESDASREMMFYFIVSIMIVAGLLAAIWTFGTSLSLSVTGVLLALGAAAWSFATTAVTMGVVVLAFMAFTNFLNTYLPTVAPYFNMMLDSIDAVYSFVIMNICHLIDAPIQLLYPKYQSIKWVGPIMFGLYSFTYDITGTVPRFMAVNIMNNKYPEYGDYRHVLFEKYEVAMMEGTYYDWSQYASDMGVGGQ
jgi:hypothetical protein